MRTSLRSISTLVTLATLGAAASACSSAPSNEEIAQRQPVASASSTSASTSLSSAGPRSIHVLTQDMHTIGKTFGNGRLCPQAVAGESQCHGHAITDDDGNIVVSTNLAGVGGLGADSLQSAYHIPAGLTSTATIAIIDGNDYPAAGSDLAIYRANYGITGDYNFKRVAQDGSTHYPSAATGNGLLEEALDLDMASAGCPTCNIILVEANSMQDTDLQAAVNTAASLGASVVSMSLGGPGDDWDSTFAAHPGIAFFASSGDNGFGVSYPAGSNLVTAVGGTALTQAPGTARGWSEVAWSGAGSGCSAEAKPSWQHDSACGSRTVADVSAVASGASPVAVRLNGAWAAAFGTSVASPLVAGIYALTGHASANGQLSYANPADFNDVTSGSNGSCGNYECNAGLGYDGPTGNGTPDAEALSGYPWITSITPSIGATAGGTVVTVTGLRFSTTPGATTFTFGGYPATNVSCSSATTCKITSPAFNPPALNQLVDVQATVASKRSDLRTQDQFSYAGTGPICSGYWTCAGTYGTETDAAFNCAAFPQNTTAQLYRQVGSSWVATSPTVYTGGGETSVSELGFIPPATQTSTTYKVCMTNTLNNQQECAAPITLAGTTASECVCHPMTCAQIGVCGTAPDECGGTVNCGTCASGQACSNNMCCPAGEAWSAANQRCQHTCNTPACQCAFAGGEWDGKTCE